MTGGTPEGPSVMISRKFTLDICILNFLDEYRARWLTGDEPEVKICSAGEGTRE
jgi:hypothetical protein